MAQKCFPPFSVEVDAINAKKNRCPSAQISLTDIYVMT